MKTKILFKKTIYVTAFFLFAALFSCNKEDTPLEEDTNLSENVLVNFKESSKALELPSEMQNSTNVYARQAAYQFQSMLSNVQIFSDFSNVPSNSETSRVGGLYTYVWTNGGITVTYSITELTDRFTFSYKISEGGDSKTLISGYELKNGTYAEMSFFDDSGVSLKLVWQDLGGIATFEIFIDDLKIKMEYNKSDMSGSIKIFDSSSLTAEYVWHADGSGYFKDYENNEQFSW